MAAKSVLQRNNGISLKQFDESFDGSAIRAMQLLMQSPRVNESDVDAVVRGFERDMHVYNGRRTTLNRMSVVVDGVFALAALSRGWGLLQAAGLVIAKYLVGRSVLADEQAASVIEP